MRVFDYFYRAADSEDTRRTKDILVANAILGFCLGGVYSVTSQELKLLRFCSIFTAMLSFVALVKWFITKNVTNFEIALYIYLQFAVVLVVDLISSSEMNDPSWIFTVLLLDVILICSLPQWVDSGMICILVIFLMVSCIESITRFGLFDIIDVEKMRHFRNCVDLTEEEIASSPCKRKAGAAIGQVISYIFIFVLDYYCTRSFAVGMKTERQKLRASVSLAETVVAALVRFDLQEAKMQIENVDKNDFTEIFSQLLDNLYMYRPYLPDSLFELSEQREFDMFAKNDVRPPQNQAAIVFTDIKSSTAIWEASPEAMKRALKLHNNIVRCCIANFGGYEVKTIGDAFMVAFSSICDASSFSMAVQERLGSTIWPSDLVLPNEFKEHNWNGLMVRIGLHEGPVTTEVDPISGRVDYFGGTVNKAARLESACIPGGIAFDVSKSEKVTLSNENWYFTTVTKLLRGISEEPIDIDILLPKEKDFKTFEFVPFCREQKPSRAHREQDFDLPLRKTYSTTCCTGFEILEFNINNHSHFQEQVNAALVRCISFVERTEGSVVSVVACSVVVSWNTARFISDHFQNGVRFISLMYGDFKTSTTHKIHTGISSGHVLSGTVGNSDQRFVSVFGTSVRTSHLLCQSSFDLNVFALCATLGTDFPLRRPVDCWNIDNQRCFVYEIQSERLKSYFSTLQCDKTECVELMESWGWGEDYHSAFAKRDWQTILRMAPQSDHVLHNVVQMLQLNKSLQIEFNSESNVINDFKVTL